MLNVMEERDIQIRGYVLRLPLDVLVVASANPEDYTNRGRIITPLKDRFGAEIRTHYPTELDDEIAVIRQEAHLRRRGARPPGRDPGPVHPRRCASRTSVDQRSGVCARFAIAGAETVAASALHRATAPGRGRGRWPGSSTSRPPSTCSAARSSSRPARRAARARSSTTCCAPRPPRRSAHHFRGLDFALLVDAHRGRRDGDDRRAGHRPRLPDRAAGAGRVRALRRGLRPARRAPTTASGPAPSSSRSRGSTSPAGSARSPAAARPSMASSRPRAGARHRYGRYDGGPDPLAPPVDLAEALDAIGEDVMAGYSPERAMREFLRRGGQDQRGLDDLARRVAEQRRELTAAAQPRRHARGGPRAARPRGARGAQAAGPRRRPGRRRPRAARDAARQPAAVDGGRGQRARRRTTGRAARRARTTSRSRTCSAARCSTSGSPA